MEYDFHLKKQLIDYILEPYLFSRHVLKNEQSEPDISKKMA